MTGPLTFEQFETLVRAELEELGTPTLMRVGDRMAKSADSYNELLPQLLKIAWDNGLRNPKETAAYTDAGIRKAFLDAFAKDLL